MNGMPMTNSRVLVLDDDYEVGRTIVRVAEAAGMEARSVSQPDRFFEEIDRWHPTHIVLDLVMPEMDGVEVMRLLAERRSAAGIIISSGVGGRVLQAAQRSATEHGLRILGVLPKPFASAALKGFLEEPGTRGDRTPASARPAPGGWEPGEAHLDQALAENQIGLFYQPKVNCSTGALSGFEGLARWQHPEAGMIMPDRFIPLAEETGLIDPMTDQILNKALRWISTAHAESDLTISVNISSRSLVDLQFADRVAELCDGFAVARTRLILELTETAAMEDPVAALDLLTRLRMKEVRVSIDDFGTGFSSMAQLARLPFSEMKVDKSFVMTAAASTESRTIIKSIVDLGHNLDLRVTAEGVEDEATLVYLTDIGCDFAQGYHIARPMDEYRLAAWLAERG